MSFVKTISVNEEVKSLVDKLIKEAADETWSVFFQRLVREEWERRRNSRGKV